MLIGILGWAICGVILGFIASSVVNLRGDDPRIGIGVGLAGGVVGGWLFSMISGSPVIAFNVWSIVCANVLAVACVTMWHMVRSRVPYEAPSIRRSN